MAAGYIKFSVGYLLEKAIFALLFLPSLVWFWLCKPKTAKKKAALPRGKAAVLLLSVVVPRLCDKQDMKCSIHNEKNYHHEPYHWVAGRQQVNQTDMDTIKEHIQEATPCRFRTSHIMQSNYSVCDSYNQRVCNEVQPNCYFLPQRGKGVGDGELADCPKQCRKNLKEFRAITLLFNIIQPSTYTIYLSKS